MVKVNGHWYCKHCMVEVSAENVTYMEMHDVCGYPVVWVKEQIAGMLLTQPQKEFFKLTGKSPLIVTTYNGECVTTASPEYWKFLETLQIHKS